jgi:hypothetical protein
MASRYLTNCCVCGERTSKNYARNNNGKCKACVTGVSQLHRLKCPDCGEMTLTHYQKIHHYHCDNCTRAADPEGYLKELNTISEPSEDFGW